MTYIISILLVIIILLIFFYLDTSSFNKIKYNGGDGRQYKVLKDKPNADKAAKILAEINKFSIEFINKLKKKYLYNEYTCFNEPHIQPDDDFIPKKEECINKGWLTTGGMVPLNDYRYKAILLLVNRYRPKRLQENQPTNSSDTAWQEGGTHIISICLREQESGNYEFLDIQTIKFVLIHEMTHNAADILTHPPYFWKVFKFLLIEAQLLMNYIAPDFSKTPTNYCSLMVTYSPLYDDKIDINDQTVNLVE